MSDEDLEALREQTSQGDRLDEVGSEEETREFVDDIVAELEAIDAGEQQKTVSVWDGPMAAYVRALGENPDRMEAVGENLQDRLDVDVENIGRSEILRLALRLGFETAAPDDVDAVREAVQEQATKGL